MHGVGPGPSLLTRCKVLIDFLAWRLPHTEPGTPDSRLQTPDTEMETLCQARQKIIIQQANGSGANMSATILCPSWGTEVQTEAEAEAETELRLRPRLWLQSQFWFTLARVSA